MYFINFNLVVVNLILSFIYTYGICIYKFIILDSLNKENLTHDEKLVVICPTKQGKLGCSIIRLNDTQ